MVLALRCPSYADGHDIEIVALLPFCTHCVESSALQEPQHVIKDPIYARSLKQERVTDLLSVRYAYGCFLRNRPFFPPCMDDLHSPGLKEPKDVT